jgi:GT2 family glycosyltransferase
MAPRVSVVIPTHARETRLAFGLEALAAQTLDPDEFEVIVVRPHEAEGPFATPPDGLDVRELRAPRGPGSQRNAGWRAASGEWIAFVDDDCRVTPGWLWALLAAAEREEGEVIVQGRTEPDPDEAHLLFGMARTIRITAPSGLYETCNLLVRRELLERLAGFDEKFDRYGWGEDTDLGLRAEELGARLAWADDALAWHAVYPNPLPHALRDARRRRGFARLIGRHPRLRERMPLGLFVSRKHAGVAALALGAACAALGGRRARPVAVAAALPYAAEIAAGFARQRALSPRSLARLALHLPARLTADATETAATVRGAIEERTPVI